MRKGNLFLVLFLVLMSTTLPAAHHATSTLNEKMIRDYFNGWDTANIEKVMGYFSADIVYEDVPKAEIAKGTNAVKVFVEQFFS